MTYLKLLFSAIFLAIFHLCIAQTIYVAPEGSDTNEGTFSSPVKSFKKAADLAIERKASVVEFADGNYVFDSTVVLSADYNGITFKAAEDARPVFSSLVRLSGWKQYNGNIMVADLPEDISHVRYLQDASEDWMPRSETEYFEPAEYSDFCSEDPMYEKEMRGFPDIQQYKTFVTYPDNWEEPDWTFAGQYDLRYASDAWAIGVLPVSHVETGEKKLHVATPSTYVMLDPHGDCSKNQGWLLNTIEGIDKPGEWACIDGKIYLYPKSGTDDIYVPRITELICLDAGGDGNTWNGTPVENINFEGITFTGSDFYIRQYDYDNPENSDVTTQHDWGLVDCPAGMLRFRNAKNCRVENCKFLKSGGGGIRLDRYCQKIKILNNEFKYLGREAVSLTGRGIGYGDVNRDNEIAYNNIVATGREKWDAPAINMSQSSNNHIHHNYIEDTHYSAIISTSSRSVYIGFKSYEDSDDYFIGSECHYWEVKPEVVDISDDAERFGYEKAKIETHKYMYNYNNVIEKNVITDAHNGGKFFHVDDILPTNGIVYISGATYNRTNYLRLNYFMNCDPQPNTQLLYADTYMDHMHANQNMIYNVKIGNEPGEAYVLFDVFCNWQDWDVQHGNQQGYVQANVAKSTSYGGFAYGKFIDVSGNVDLDRSSSKAAAEHLDYYREMLNTLDIGELPGPSPLPGSSEIKNGLEDIINELETTGYNPVKNKKTFTLMQNTPNPFSSRTHIPFQLQKDSHVTLDIINNLGQEVAKLLDKRMPAGEHQIPLDGSALSGGFYFYRLRTPEHEQVKKLLKYDDL